MSRSDYRLPGIYNSSPITLTSGRGSALAVDSSGQLLVSGTGGTGASATQVQGTAADNAAAVGNPVLIGGQYNSSAPTYDNGDVAKFQVDVNGNQKVTLATLLAGENLTLNRLMNQQLLTYNAVIVADAQIKAGAGVLGFITIACNDSAPTAGTIIVYDSLTETGTQVFNTTITTTYFTPQTYMLNINMTTGIYVGFTTTADVNVTIGYL